MDLGISGKRALVLAASRGLGAGIAEALAAEGVEVLLCGRTEERLKANCDAINAKGAGKASYIVADLAEPNFAETMAKAANKRLGGVDILINNTGGPVPGVSEAMTAEHLTNYFQSMVVSVITLANLLLPDMKEQGWGRILTCASSGVIEPIPNLALSNTLRASLAGWSKTLSSEVAQFGITSNLLLPGRILTDRIMELDSANAKKNDLTLDEVRAKSLQTIPAGRLGDVKEFAATAAFLVSQPASYITGTMVRCDGGAAKSI